MFGVFCNLPLVYVAYILDPVNDTRMQEWLCSYSRVIRKVEQYLEILAKKLTGQYEGG
jgi:hypothetical protein